ncbi:MAG: toprim domain-containing protein [Planctomycetia bacterium]|nr:toprim domain-containing protein [Planctomycetia bacterium]
MPTPHRTTHRAVQAVSILEVARALGLNTDNRRARCFQARNHTGGGDRTPSLVFFPDAGRYRCFGCGIFGDSIDLVRAIRGNTFPQAVAWLEALARSGPSRPTSSSTSGSASGRGQTALLVYQRLWQWSAVPTSTTPVGTYLLRRGLDPERAAALGAREILDPDRTWQGLQADCGADLLSASGLVSQRGNFLFAHHSLLFFYLDGDQPVFVQARALSATAAVKELRPGRVTCPLPFNRNVLTGSPAQVWVCEGCIDTLSAAQLGYAAVGIPGVHAFQADWFELFRNVARIQIVFDNDTAGRLAGAELRSQFRLRGLPADAFTFPHCKDVNDYLTSLPNGVAHVSVRP